MNSARITGTGSYLPEKVLTNADLERMVETSDEWITERTGIKERRVAAEGETTCDLGEAAARRAMEAAGVEADEIDLIVFATTTPDRVFPSTACLLQERLGIHGSPAFDIQAVCTGFVYALSVADKFIASGGVRNALVVGAETLSRITDWTDRSTCVLFADGAGAVVLSAAEEGGILSTHLHADGAFKDLLDERGAAGMTLFCPETLRDEATFQCRFLQPDERRCEDIASGTCMAALAAYAVEHGLVSRSEHVRIVTEQGAMLGRPTLATVDVRVLSDQVHRVEVAGTGAVVMRGSFQFQRLASAAAQA